MPSMPAGEPVTLEETRVDHFYHKILHLNYLTLDNHHYTSFQNTLQFTGLQCQRATCIWNISATHVSEEDYYKYKPRLLKLRARFKKHEVDNAGVWFRP